MSSSEAELPSVLPSRERVRSFPQVPGPVRRAAGIGLLGAAGLLGFYLVIVWLGSKSWSHAVDLLLTDRYYVAAVAAGFGIQIGLYAYVRRLLRGDHGLKSSTAVAAAGTGTSTTSMIACCLHHVADVLPVVGLSGAAVFLSNYKIPLIVVGLITNAIGITLMTRIILHYRRTLAGAIRVPAGAQAAPGDHCHVG